VSKTHKAERNKLRPVDRKEYDTADGVPVIRLTVEEIAFFATEFASSNKKKNGA
jgi:hypothetical protein